MLFVINFIRCYAAYAHVYMTSFEKQAYCLNI